MKIEVECFLFQVQRFTTDPRTLTCSRLRGLHEAERKVESYTPASRAF